MLKEGFSLRLQGIRIPIVWLRLIIIVVFYFLW